MGLLAPNPRHLLKKVDENFQTWVRCEHRLLDGRTHYVYRAGAKHILNIIMTNKHR